MLKIPYLSALNHMRNLQPSVSVRVMDLEEACGSVLAEPLYARYSMPPSPVSAMDGFAVISSQTGSASADSPVTLTEFERVNTGNPVSGTFDAVIMIEDVSVGEHSITITSPIKKGKNVRLAGEDIKKGRMILPAGARLRAFDIGALANYGYSSVPVKHVSVGMLPTGTELISPGTEPKAGQVVESNSYMVAAYLRQFGVSVVRYPGVDDDRDLLRAAIAKAVDENDIVLISAGSSMGSKDYTESIIAELGTVVFHGVSMKPAKPVMLGLIKGKPVIGLPGFPLAAATVLRVFLRPLLESWGFVGPETTAISARAGSVVETEESIDEFRFASAAFVEGRYVVLPQIRSASALMNSIKANAYIHIPRGVGTASAGESVTVVAEADSAELKSTVLIGGTYSKGLESLIQKLSESGLSVRIGEGSPEELLEGMFCHAVCTAEDVTPSCPTKKFSLGDGSYLIVRTDMKDPYCSVIKEVAGELYGA
ncbi:MAG TPA: molybdopterin molybdotransferase MoeA [Methanocorpusculum sp.]|nr:molybdopterin molybdotransferase MoeA [Methanocorpusculum sp.]